MITVVYRKRSRKRPTKKARVSTWTEALDVIKQRASTTALAVTYDEDGELRAYRWRRFGPHGAQWERLR